MRKLLIFLAVVMVTSSLEAQWRRGALYGADVRALIGDPNSPDTFYLGTSGGEVYVSRDGAKSWSNPRGSIPFPGYVVDNLVLDRTGRLWAASWGLWGGGVIAVSDDGGKSWVRRDAGLEDFSVRAIAIDVNDSDFILVGGLTGVYRSFDGGEEWEQISDQINVESLAIDPRDRDRIYVGTWRQGLRTEDGGETWKLINNGMVLDTDMFSITIDAENPDSIWVSTCGWVYNTENRGDKWTRYRDGFNNRRIHDIEIDPCNRDSLYAGSVAGLYRSEDRGKTWYTVSDEELVINSVVLHPQRPNRIVLGVEGDGVYVSHDNARTFHRSSDGLRNLRVTSIMADPANQRHVFAAVVFGGAASGVYRSTDDGTNWEKVSKTRLPEVLSLVIAPEMDVRPRFVAGTEKGFFASDDGVTWTQSEPSQTPLRVEKVVRFNRNRFFAATVHGVFTSRDSGRSWYRLAEAGGKTLDIAVGSLGTKKALFALTSAGLRVFDGERWSGVANAPEKGRTLAIRRSANEQTIFIAGMQGVKAGRIDADLTWRDSAAPDAQYAAVHAASRNASPMLFLTSRQQREILVGDPEAADWMSMTLPSRTAEVTSVAADPFDKQRYFVGTLGEGVYVYEGATTKYTQSTSSAVTAAGGGGGGSR